MKRIIISLVVFLFLSFIFLAWTETKQQSAQSQNWWVVYFANPKDGSLDFIIENNGNNKNFHYSMISGEKILKEADIEITKGEKKAINIPKSDFVNLENKKIIIRINSGNDSKEIYKNF